jgi:hypothetical protein
MTAHMSEDEHRAWFASLSPDERAVAHVPRGYLMCLVEAALAKRTLVKAETDANTRLAVLKTLEACIYGLLTAEILALVEPATEATVAIVEQARRLDREGNHRNASYQLLTGWATFQKIVRLEPGILDACRRFHAARAAVGVSEPVPVVPAEPPPIAGARPFVPIEPDWVTQLKHGK